MLLNNPPLGPGEPRGVPNDPKSLLFIGLNYAPEMIGVGPYTAGLAEEMARRAHGVEVVTGQPHYPRRWTEWTGRGWSNAHENGVTVRRCPVYTPRRPTSSRLAQALSFVLAAILPLVSSVRSRSPDAIVAIVAIVPALSVAVLAFLLARALRVPFWLHLHRLRPPPAAGEGAVARLARQIEGALLARADQVSCASEVMADAVRATGVPRERVLVLRPWANHAAAIGRASGAGVRRELGAGRRTVALYSGAVAAGQGLEVVVEAARRLRHRRDLLFVICGEGPDRARLEEQAASLSNVVFRPLTPPAAYAQTMRAADIHLLPRSGGSADLSPPAKLPNMLASGKPVVAMARAGTDLAREVIGAGLAVPPGDAGALARAVTRLADDRELAQAFGEEGRRRAAARWSLDLTADRFERRLTRLVRQARFAGERSRAAIPAE